MFHKWFKGFRTIRKSLFKMKSNSFDHKNWDSWYFGAINRQKATYLLMNEKEDGVFLVRDSQCDAGDYVLCVKEDNKVNHYIINRIQNQNNDVTYRIGDRTFANLPKILRFYKLHYLYTTTLIRPVYLPV